MEPHQLVAGSTGPQFSLLAFYHHEKSLLGKNYRSIKSAAM